MNNQNWRKLIPEVLEQLRSAPEKIYQAQEAVNLYRANVAGLTESLTIAELDAGLAAYTTVAHLESERKILADEKKMLVERAAMDDEGVSIIKNQITAAEEKLSLAKATLEKEQNIFSAAKTLAELAAAMLQYTIPGI